jgi:hypothetical protein
VLRILAALGVVALAVFFGGRHWISAQIENRLRGELEKRGVTMERKNASWDPWRGLHLTGLRLHQKGAQKQKIAELENLNLRIPLSGYFGSKPRTTHWHISDSSVTFHDAEGPVTLDHFSLRLSAGSGKIHVGRVAASKEGLTAKLSGTIMTSAVESTAPVRLDLAAVRATLATLNVRTGTGPFQVTGKFHIDATASDPAWSATLDGKGTNLEWNEVRWTKAVANAELSAKGSAIHYDLSTAHGSTQGTASVADWDKSPLIFSGHIQDSKGRKDEYRGRHHERVFTVETLKGDADLWALSAAVPAATVRFPEQVKIQTPPLIDARNIRYDSNTEPPRWTVGTVTLSSPDPVVFTTGKNQIEARDLAATASYNGRDWTIRDSHTQVLGGSLSLQGRFRDGVLHKARVKIEDIRLSQLRRLSGSGSGKPSSGVISAAYQGSIDFPNQQGEGTGTMRMDDAPVIEVPLLDQVFELFAAVIPGVQRPTEGRFDAEFKVRPDIVHVSRFEAKGGSSLTVSATGTVDLKKRRVAGRARGKLVGLPGLVTGPLSRLLEMEVAGPYDDIRLKPLGPARLASNTVSGTVGVAVDTVEEAGKITGTVLTEGLKVPFKLFGKDPPHEDKPDR